MIVITQKGDFGKTLKWLSKNKTISSKNIDRIASRGLQRLKNATPIDTGKTSDSWYYTMEIKNHQITITYHNDNIQNGVNVAILLQYGHATRDGGWINGLDYINPALKPIFDDIRDSVWKEVKQ